MSTELAVRAAASLPDKIEYARFLAKSGLLPASFRQHPENVLYAYEYGELLGLHPMAAITGIHVIDGRPSISAGLISALVRRAGHRIRVQGDDTRARCQIIRSDDPGFTYAATWTIDRAKQAGLLGKTNWQRYPAAMLKARAVSECARDACQEVLLGIKYTPDELGAEDDGGEIIHDGFPTMPNGQVAAHQMTEDEKDAAGLMTRPQRVAHNELRDMDPAPPGAVDRVIPDPDDSDPWATEPPAATPPQPATPKALEKMTGLLDQLGFSEDDATRLIHWLAGDGYTATRSEVRLVTSFIEDHLKAAGGDTADAAAKAWAQYETAIAGA